MIEKIDIQSFGSFKNFQWDSNVRESQKTIGRFKKLNIIYGRNYAGKTTLSRVFRSFEVGKSPARFENPSFKIKTSNGFLTQEQISNHNSKIRVYNKDFVEDNLAFLRDECGNITPFAIIGSENKEIELQIEEVRAKLGSKELNTGLRAEYAKKKDEINRAKILLDGKKESLNKKIFDKANNKPKGIKHNPIYKSPYYDVRDLSADMVAATTQNIEPLGDEDRAEKIKFLTEQPLNDIAGPVKFKFTIDVLWSKAQEISSFKIKPSAPLQDLLNSAVLTQWVKAGKEMHAERSTCAFCRQKLPESLWQTLDKHFNEESEALHLKIKGVLEEIQAEESRLNNFIMYDKEKFYLIFHAKYDELDKNIRTSLANYMALLSDSKNIILERSKNIFVDKFLDDVDFACVSQLEKLIEDFDLLAESNNAYTAQISKTQKNLRDELRLSEVSKFIFDIGLKAVRKDIEDFEKHEKDLLVQLNVIENQGKELNARLEELQSQLRDEKRGAEQVNRYLGHSLGGTNLRLVAEEQAGQAAYKFRIMRGEKAAYDLSEGECSLVSFCYFLARLEDAHTKGSNPVIYIDDPISSLDGNHIFFIFSLIEAFIARPLRGSDGLDLKDLAGKKLFKYEQLFISTHNLDFLKYLKRLSKPEEVEKFLIVRKIDSSSIELMPKHLRNYITELNYLFGEIYTCSDEEKSIENYHSFYNFGNNLRKFLEAFLFFKYPSSEINNDGKLRLYFGSDDNSVDFVNRLTNEHSHLEEFVDRGMVPIDCAEISKMAVFVLKAMRQKDFSQYEHFLKSIGATDFCIKDS